MRYEYVHPFVSSAQEVLERVLSARIQAGSIRLSPLPAPSSGVAAIVGVTGESGGRVIFDMSCDTAVAIAARMNSEPQDELTSLVRDSLSELAGMMTGRAISVLNDKGYSLRISPPTLIAGDNVTFSDVELETMVVPLETTLGEVIVNVAMATD